jgi:hypothetical protein
MKHGSLTAGRIFVEANDRVLSNTDGELSLPPSEERHERAPFSISLARLSWETRRVHECEVIIFFTMVVRDLESDS